MGAMTDEMSDKEARGFVMTPEELQQKLKEQAEIARRDVERHKTEMLAAETRMNKLQAAYEAMQADPAKGREWTSHTTATTLRPFICSGMAACTASFVIHPIDLAKVRLQLFSVQNPDLPKPNFVKMLGDMAKNEGISACYAGLSASIARQAIYGTARLSLHTIFSDKMQEMQGGGPVPFWKKTLAATAAGATAVLIGTPFDVALVRMQADGMKPKAEQRNYKNVVHALTTVTKEEGVTALWKGLAPNIMRGISMNVGMMAFYDQAKETVGAAVGDPDLNRPLMVTKMGSAAVAGFMCAFLSLPFDMAKSRLQDMRPDAKTGKMPYAGVSDFMRTFIAKEGFPKLWTGFTAYYFRCAPHAMTILIVREEIYKQYDKMTGREVAGLL